MADHQTGQLVVTRRVVGPQRRSGPGRRRLLTMSRPQSGNRKALYIVGGVLAVVVLAVISYVYFQKGGTSASSSDLAYPTQVQGSVVIAGKGSGTTIDVYEDFLCPICGRFESQNGAALAQAISDGKVQVKYH